MSMMHSFKEQFFNQLQDMEDFFRKQQEEDTWKQVYLHEVKAIELPAAPICLSSIIDDLGMDSENTEQVETAMATTNLVLTLPLSKGENIPVNECAMNSIIARSGVGKGPFFKVATPEVLADFLNLAYSSFSKEMGIVLIRDGMVAAFHSNNYRVLPIIDALVGADRYLPSNEFDSGYYSIELTIANFKLFDLDIIEAYNEEISKLGGETLSGKPMIRVTSSDIGTSALRLSPFIERDDGVQMQIGTPLALTHDSGHTMAEYISNCKSVYSLFSEAGKKAGELASTVINHPQGCYHLIGKALDLPKKYVKAACDLFMALLVDDYTYASSIYNSLWDIVSLMKADGATPSKILSVEENIARALSKKFTDYDHEYFWE